MAAVVRRGIIQFSASPLADPTTHNEKGTMGHIYKPAIFKNKKINMAAFQTTDSGGKHNQVSLSTVYSSV